MVGQAPGAHDALIGTTLGSYRVMAKIGQGGMGAVYVAEHPVIGRRVAVKVILPQFAGSAELIGRFHNEARAAAQLRHPAFVDVFDFGTLSDGSAYLVMDFLEGQSLDAAMVRVVRLPLAMVFGLLRQIAVAVGVAHDHGIVHRDLKPDNVFLSPQPDGSGFILVKVLDFGVAKLIQANDEAGPVTRTGVMLGTPLYMSPEQCKGAGRVDQRSDIYAFGCIMHAVLTGRPPFALDGMGEVIGAHIYQKPPGVRQAVPTLPVELEAFVLRCLAKDPAERPASMAAVVAAIDGLRTNLGFTTEDLRVPTASLGLLPGGAAASVGGMPVRDGSTSVLPPAGTTVLLPSPSVGLPPGNTTLGQSAAAISTAERTAPRRRRGPLIALLGAAGAAVVVALVLALALDDGRRGGSSAGGPPGLPATVPVGVPDPVSPPARPPTPTIPQAEDEPTPARGPATVRIVIGSVPAGATVLDGRTGERLGNTPLDRSFDRQEGTLEVSVERSGYHSKRTKVSLREDAEITVTLTRRSVTPKVAPPSPTVVPAAPPVRAVDPQAIRKL